MIKLKCLCFSDSHGYTYYMRSAIKMHPDAEVIFFLGDGLEDIAPLVEEDRSRMWIYVRGNCDYRTVGTLGEVKKTEAITLCGRKILCTHGDLHGVKYGEDGLLLLAERTGADIILFGHTHRPYEKYIPRDTGGLYLFNPGSICGSYGERPSFGVINISDSGVLLSHGNFV